MAAATQIWRRGERPPWYLVPGAWCLVYQDDANALQILDGLASRGANLHARNAVGQTPLHLAAKRGRLECVKRLLQFGADPLAADRCGRTAADDATGGSRAWIEKTVSDRYHVTGPRR